MTAERLYEVIALAALGFALGALGSAMMIVPMFTPLW